MPQPQISLLKSNHAHHFYVQPPLTRLIPRRQNLTFRRKPEPNPNKFNLKCCLSSNNNQNIINPLRITTNPNNFHDEKGEKNAKNDDVSIKNTNIFEEFYSVIAETLKNSCRNYSKAVNLAVTCMAIALIFMSGYDSALALSGGRMGGRSSSSSRSSRSGGRYSGGGGSHHSGYYSYKSKTEYGEKKLDEQEKVENLNSEEILFLVILSSSIIFILIGFLYTEIPFHHISILQVAVYDAEGTFRRDLNGIAEKADTSSNSGLRRVLLGTTNLLLKNLDSCISCDSHLLTRRYYLEDAMETFDRHSLAERAKFDEETLVNVDNKKIGKSSKQDTKLTKGYTVVTILVGTEGMYFSSKLPTINNVGDLKKALQTIQSIKLSELEAVEVLWAPQKENELITENELQAKYPFVHCHQLRSVNMGLV
ncbi:uncharacterized protein LOC126659844 [Mercurialis annua]|uniref:uncharacterized protein LOC126659844 n=1 Tax=Mercurialis annua TaxID=3986 RepID=UPI00215F987F|nr:uncharacterized protein LOC126659844 [Mercurialis annua]